MSTEAQKKTQRNCMKRIREKCISEGVCVHCRKAPARAGKTCCFDCARKCSERYYRKKEAEKNEPA